MSRWIDAEYCEDFFDRWESRVKNADPVTIDVVQNTRTLLRDAPSIDIVFCKECEYYKTDVMLPNGTKVKCVNGLEDYDYCRYGKRRTDDE